MITAIDEGPQADIVRLTSNAPQRPIMPQLIDWTAPSFPPNFDTMQAIQGTSFVQARKAVHAINETLRQCDLEARPLFFKSKPWNDHGLSLVARFRSINFDLAEQFSWLTKRPAPGYIDIDLFPTRMELFVRQSADRVHPIDDLVEYNCPRPIHLRNIPTTASTIIESLELSLSLLSAGNKQSSDGADNERTNLIDRILGPLLTPILSADQIYSSVALSLPGTPIGKNGFVETWGKLVMNGEAPYLSLSPELQTVLVEEVGLHHQNYVSDGGSMIRIGVASPSRYQTSFLPPATALETIKALSRYSSEPIIEISKKPPSAPAEKVKSWLRPYESVAEEVRLLAVRPSA